MNTFMKFISLTLLTFSMTACEPSGKVGQWINDHWDIDQIFSNRPQNRTQFFAIVKLKNPALLTNAQKENGVMKVDAQALATVQAEQKAAIETLKKLSADIQVIYQYKYVLNGLAIQAPISLQSQIQNLSEFSQVELASQFSRPQSTLAETQTAVAQAFEKNSVNFIGADLVHKELGITGAGVHVGVMDTGIDYTHSMMGGVGTVDAYKNTNPDLPNESYPNDKVVGGIDLVGTKYNAASEYEDERTPKPDSNPLDEGGHGTHVAGSVAGIGNNVDSYSGVAPEAKLHAIKVFGADGSTDDYVVIAGFEYAVDPNQDGFLNDQLDVVNLSLGSSYGTPKITYAEAIRNLTNAGTIVIASAGNSGPLDYITGAPGTANEAFSVAASVDHSEHNWKFSAVSIESILRPKMLVEAIEGSISKPISDVVSAEGKLVYIGLGNADLTEEQITSLKGQIALIDRGVIPFADKIKRAFDAGAIGAIVANNQPGNPISMGGSGQYDIPAIMITQAVGQMIKEDMKTVDVFVNFKAPEKMEKPELIDTLASFTSKGPRSLDSVLKPEISAPGYQITSAEMGGGTKAVRMSGTSMAAPHMAGVAALLKQQNKAMTTTQLKSVVMGTSEIIKNEKSQRYAMTLQGAGRVNVLAAMKSKIVSDTPSISLGNLNLEKKKLISRNVELLNQGKEDITLSVEAFGSPHLKIQNVTQVQLSAGEKKSIRFDMLIDVKDMSENIVEVDSWILLKNATSTVFSIPVLAVVQKISKIKTTDVEVFASSLEESTGAVAQLTLTNEGLHQGDALLFNLLGTDQRKNTKVKADTESKNCDLKTVGYRVIEKVVEGKKQEFLQVAAQLYDNVTTWNTCEIAVLIDTNQDELPEQELVGAVLENLPGLTGTDFSSLLLDATKAREIRKNFEAAKLASRGQTVTITEDYSDALIAQNEMKHYIQSSIAIVEAPIESLKLRATGEFGIRVLSMAQDTDNVQSDDYLDQTIHAWKKLDLSKGAQGFVQMPEVVSLKTQESQNIQFEKGSADEELLVLFPHNRGAENLVNEGSHSSILKAKYQY